MVLWSEAYLVPAKIAETNLSYAAVKLLKLIMSLTNYLSELWVYAQTKEYREGLFVEASGLVLDVLLLIICVKVITYYLARQSRSSTNFASSFFITQFLREVLVLQLKSGGVVDINANLQAALGRRELESLSSHIFYGNTENLMDLLRLRMMSGDHMDGHRVLNAEQRKEVSKEAQLLLVRLDGLLVTLASLRQEGQCLRAYELRVALTALSDYLEELSNSDSAPPPRTYAPLSTVLGRVVESWFKLCKKALDRHYMSQNRRAFARLLLTLPWLISYRFVVRRLQRHRRLPYTDPYSSNFPQLFCNALAQALGAKWGEIVATSGVEKNDLQLLITQHRHLSQRACIAILVKLRPHIPAPLWNGVLTESLIADIDRVLIRVVPFEAANAAKATAIIYLKMLSSKDDSSSQLIEQTFQSLWSLGLR